MEAEGLVEGLEGLVGLGGGPLVSAGNDEYHATSVEVDPNVYVDTGSHDSHDVNTSVDSHNTTINYYAGGEPAAHDGHSHGGGAGHHGGFHGDPQVLALQQRLLDEGYDPGALDGIMGPHTEAALAAEQAAWEHHGHAEHHGHGEHHHQHAEYDEYAHHGEHAHHEHHGHHYVEEDDYEEHHHHVEVEEEQGEQDSEW